MTCKICGDPITSVSRGTGYSGARAAQSFAGMRPVTLSKGRFGNDRTAAGRARMQSVDERWKTDQPW